MKLYEIDGLEVPPHTGIVVHVFHPRGGSDTYRFEMQEPNGCWARAEVRVVAALIAAEWRRIWKARSEPLHMKDLDIPRQADLWQGVYERAVTKEGA